MSMVSEEKRGHTFKQSAKDFMKILSWGPNFYVSKCLKMYLYINNIPL